MFGWLFGRRRGCLPARLVGYLALGTVAVALGLPVLVVWGGVLALRVIGSLVPRHHY